MIDYSKRGTCDRCHDVAHAPWDEWHQMYLCNGCFLELDGWS